jgi:hypothetical protein
VELPLGVQALPGHAPLQHHLLPHAITGGVVHRAALQAALASPGGQPGTRGGALGTQVHQAGGGRHVCQVVKGPHDNRRPLHLERAHTHTHT